MKLITILTLLLCLIYNAFGQCDSLIISTYPPPTNTGDQRGNLPLQNKNSERPDMRNTFNWMLDDPSTGMTVTNFGGIDYVPFNSSGIES
jgi:hypothetical protein